MKILIETLAVFPSIPKKMSIEVPESATFHDVIRNVSLKYPEFGDTLIKNCDIHSQIVVLLNGKSISHEKGLDTTLKEGDDLYIVPLIHGG